MRRIWTLAVAGVIMALTLPVAASASASDIFHPHHGSGYQDAAVVSVENGPYGPVLVVGGAGAGYQPATSTTPAGYAYPAGSALYYATVDPRTDGDSWWHPYQPGCTTTVVPNTSQGAISCTGPETDPTADWPAFTTDHRPVAGPGANARLLGAVWRTDLDQFQVTYAGHPLYLFDPGPNSFFGANFYETVLPLPPWNTAWYLLSPWGTPATGPAALETESPQPGTSYASTELAAQMLPNAVPGGAAVSVYSFSADTGFSHCYGACARDFIPLTTVGAPTLGAGVDPGQVGVVWRFDGTKQVTYDGRPLYLSSQEQPIVGGSGLVTTGTVGNGNGTSAFGGTFMLVSP